ncbi:MAG: sugar transferase [Desulfobulbaceae bacterium]|nr:sugar transferase [Desulfobulbaceae bacterium]
MILKRAFDFLVSSVALLVLMPAFIILAVAIKLDSSGPVFYHGVRVGRFGKPFRIYKFRSMVVDAEKKGAASTSNNDMRVTSVGKFIRRFKFDELSQLINVFLGDMSFVGPRPEVQKFVDMYTMEEKEILKMRPGITDWSSIKFHNEGEIIAASGIADADEAYMKLIRPEKLRLQLKYAKERTFRTDLDILFTTVFSLYSTRLGKG